MTLLSELQPSQLYISKAKLEAVLSRLDEGEEVEPVPVKELDGENVIVDGHTRTFAFHLLGREDIRTIPETDELSWDEYRICVLWCKEEVILTISDLGERVVDKQEYQRLWLDRCARMQARLADDNKRK